MAIHGRSERGVVLALAAMFLTAIIAVSAIGIEVSRLTDTATEVQVAADAAALAAAQNIIKGGTAGTATTTAQTVAAKNSADGRAPAAAEVGIEFGTYSAVSGFTPGTPDNAVRATVGLANVRYLLASIFGGGASTTVTKRSVATYVCTGNARPTAPLAIGDCQLRGYTQGQPCSSQGTTLTTTPDTTQNSCWLAQPSDAPDWFPDVPGCGSGTRPLLAVGDPLTSINNGSMTPIYRAFQSCVRAGVHDFVIPVVPCPIANCNNGTSVGQVAGFATIHIAQPSDIVANGPEGGSLTFTQICNNNVPGTGGAAGPSCFGSGNATLVADRG